MPSTLYTMRHNHRLTQSLEPCCQIATNDMTKMARCPSQH